MTCMRSRKVKIPCPGPSFNGQRNLKRRLWERNRRLLRLKEMKWKNEYKRERDEGRSRREGKGDEMSLGESLCQEEGLYFNLHADDAGMRKSRRWEGGRSDEWKSITKIGVGQGHDTTNSSDESRHQMDRQGDEQAMSILMFSFKSEQKPYSLGPYHSFPCLLNHSPSLTIQRKKGESIFQKQDKRISKHGTHFDREAAKKGTLHNPFVHSINSSIFWVFIGSLEISIGAGWEKE